MKPKYNFEDCVSRKSPGGQRRDFLVIFDHKLTKPFSFVNAYLNAAEIVVKSLGENRINAADDLLALPLLNLYVNALEFSLKFHIEVAESHRRDKCCNTINPPPSGFEKILFSSHDLSSLISIIEIMQPSSSPLHKIDEFEFIKTFISKFMDAGIRSESTRYIHDSNKSIYDLYKNQTWIYPFQLHITVKAICNILLNSVLGDEFQLCALGEFSKKREEELSYCIMLMERYDSLLRVFEEGSNDSQYGTLKDIFNKDAMLIDYKRTQDLISQIEGFEKKQLAALCMGLYFSRTALQVENLEYFESWDKDELLRKICERAYQYSWALAEIKKHYEYVKSYRHKRGFSK